MSALTTDLDLKVPVIAAPMAGGASTPALVVAAARVGGLGFLAAGYKTPQALSDQMDTMRTEESRSVSMFLPPTRYLSTPPPSEPMPRRFR
ncbi:hypothetical protein GCM10020255_036200 [Rhodococcus baikonurensis]